MQRFLHTGASVVNVGHGVGRSRRQRVLQHVQPPYRLSCTRAFVDRMRDVAAVTDTRLDDDVSVDDDESIQVVDDYDVDEQRPD